MKNFLLILFFGIIFGNTAATSQNDINQLDEQGRRHGMWKKHYPDSEQLRYEGQFEHGKEIGNFKFYCEDCKSRPSVTKSFQKNSEIVDVKYFTNKGNVLSEGKMKGKERVGEWLYYHTDSKVVMTRENYSNGVINGKTTTYYPNGKITEETEFKNGIKEGENNYYSPDGVLLKKLFYKNDQLDGRVFYYDSNGDVKIEGNYKDGKKRGLWKYYKDGKVVEEETFPKKNRE